MVYNRILKLLLIVVVMVICLVLPTLAAEEVLSEQSAVGNHYETPLVLNLTAGQMINIDANCTDAYGTGIVYVHYFEVGAAPSAQRSIPNSTIRFTINAGIVCRESAQVTPRQLPHSIVLFWAAE
jgi:hypothetical protein